MYLLHHYLFINISGDIMNFSCGNKTKTFSQLTNEVVNIALENKEYFNYISFYLSKLSDNTFSDVLIEISSEIYQIKNTNTEQYLNTILESIKSLSKPDFSDFKGEFLELVIYNLYDNTNINKKAECLPSLSNKKIEIYHNGNLLDKRLDAVFWSNHWIELHECKYSLKSFLNDNNEKSKIIFMNKLYYKLNNIFSDINLYLTTLSPASEIKNRYIPADNLEKRFRDFLKDNILKELSEKQEVKINLIYKETLTQKLFNE